MDLANFLAELRSQGKATSTFRVHRAAVSTTLRQLGRSDFREDPLLSFTLLGAANQEARSPRRIPAWDLILVLSSLKLPPYEPLSEASLKFLSLKTAFLITLASGRRMSEVTNLSGSPRDIARNPDGSYSLKFLPEFLAKNQRPGDPSPSILIPPLPAGPDSVLCPVRVLRRYLSISKSLRRDRRQLFLSLNPNYGKDVSVNTVSRWIRETISLAYKGEAVNPRPHEVRAWSSSLALSLNGSLKDILAAAYWRSPSPFVSHYLRDVSSQREDGDFAFSSVAVAQQAFSRV